MMIKTIVKFLTGTVIVVTTTLSLLSMLQKKRDTNMTNQMGHSGSNAMEFLKAEEANKEYVESNTVKEAAGIAIATRHEEASTVIKEALSNINNTESQSNDSAFEEMSKDLELLSK